MEMVWRHLYNQVAYSNLGGIVTFRTFNLDYEKPYIINTNLLKWSVLPMFIDLHEKEKYFKDSWLTWLAQLKQTYSCTYQLTPTQTCSCNMSNKQQAFHVETIYVLT